MLTLTNREARAMLDAIGSAMERFAKYLGLPCDDGNMDMIK